MNKDQVNRLFKLCLDINGIEQRQKEISGNLPTVFFEFTGHCAVIIIRVYINGWKEFTDASRRFDLRIDIPEEEKEDSVEYRAVYGDKYQEALEYLEGVRGIAERRVRSRKKDPLQ